MRFSTHFSTHTGRCERRTDQQNVGRLQELIQPLRRTDPVDPLSDQLEKRRKLADDWWNFCSQIGNTALIT
jgi:uncharacterized protein YcaQ